MNYKRNIKGEFSGGVITKMKRIILGIGRAIKFTIKWAFIGGMFFLLGYGAKTAIKGNEIVIEQETGADEVIEQLIQREVKRIESDPHSKAAIDRMMRGLAIEAINSRVVEKFDAVEKEKEVAEIKAKIVN